jgi:hypothetical protein
MNKETPKQPDPHSFADDAQKAKYEKALAASAATRHEPPVVTPPFVPHAEPKELHPVQAVVPAEVVEKTEQTLAEKYNFAEYDEVKHWSDPTGRISGQECYLYKGGQPVKQVTEATTVAAANAFQDAFNKWKRENP